MAKVTTFNSANFTAYQIIRNNQFVLNFPSKTREVKQHIQELNIATGRNSDHWKVDSLAIFIFYSVLDAIHTSHPTINRSTLVWNKLSAKKMSTCTYKAINKSLHIADRLSNFGVQIDYRCSLCRIEQESHDHIFFQFSFSMYFLSFIKLKLEFQI